MPPVAAPAGAVSVTSKPSMRSRGTRRPWRFSIKRKCASVAGLMPGANGQTLYAAVKSFLIKFSESLSQESTDRGLHVTVLCPGFTWSEFHDVTGTRSMMDKLPKWMWLQAHDVARAGIEALERGQVIMVPGWRYRLMHGITRHLPDNTRLKLMARNSSKIRKAD